MPFEDHQGEMFGRADDVQTLVSRADTVGITAVVARPKAGKTWTLEAAANQLAASQFLVGYHQVSSGESPLLFALKNLYVNWLEAASLSEQTESLYLRHKGKLLTKAGVAVGKMLGSVASIGEPLTGPISQLVSNTFDGLQRAQNDLQTASLNIKPLPYELTKDLLEVLHTVSGQRAIIILDAWEKTQHLDTERDQLVTWLSRYNEWPHLHVFLGIREPDPDDHDRGEDGLNAARALDRSSALAGVHPLPPLNLEDPSERDRLLAHIRMAFPAAAELSDEQILRMLDGSDTDQPKYHAGVLGTWRESLIDAGECSADLLRTRSDEAHLNRYGELEHKLAGLDGDRRRLAIRFALMPRMDKAFWQAVRNAVLSNIQSDHVLDLIAQGLLDPNATPDNPTYGHDTRHTAARHYIATIQKIKPFASAESDRLIIDLCETITAVSSKQLPSILAVLELREATDLLSRSETTQTLLESAETFAGQKSSRLLHSTPEIDSGVLKRVRAFLAMALLNTQGHAKEEGELQRRDQILDEIRKLQLDFNDDPAVRAPLAMALLNTLIDAKEENTLQRRDQILDELRKLQQDFNDDPAVREPLAKALLNTLNHAKEENTLQRRDQILGEIRKLQQDFNDDPAVRERLARALLNTLIDAKEENTLQRRDQILGELRKLQLDFNDDPAVREPLAKALRNTLIHAKEENTLQRRDQILGELRKLQLDFNDDPAVREQLAKALRNTLNHAKEDNTLQRRDQILGEIRKLQQDFNDDPAVRERLAKALLNTLIDAKEENTLQRRDQILDEIRKLQQDFNDDPAVREQLARALFNTLIDAIESQNRPRAEALFQELTQVIAHIQPGRLDEPRAVLPALKQLIDGIE